MTKTNFLATIILALAPMVATAQSQTPINITATTVQGSPAQFTSYSGLNATFTFQTQNTLNGLF